MRIDPQADRDLIAAFHHPDAAAPGGVRGTLSALHPRPRYPAMQILRAVMTLAGPHAELVRHGERPWASITFSGARHTVVLGFEGAEGIAAGEAFIAALPEHEFTVRGQLVADATVTSMLHDTLPWPRMVVEAELLLLEDC